MDDNSLRAIKWLCLATVLISFAIVGGCHFTNRVALEKGLCQKQGYGLDNWYWQECEVKK